MAVCLDCKADYIRGITVCPACNRPLEPDPAPEPAPSPDFVPLMSASFSEASAAMASLEAAGLETRAETGNYIPAYFTTPFFMTVLVREKDLDAARAALRMPNRDA